MLSKIVVEDGIQNVNECRESIFNISKALIESDLTSTFITNGRIETLRRLLNLMENYNNQLKELEKIN